MKWQIQEAKQKFSEVLRAAHADGPQVVTKHGEEVAVVIDIAEYRKLTRTDVSFVDHLLSLSLDSDDFAGVIDKIESERRNSFPRDLDL